MKKLVQPENEAEATALQSLLQDHGIPTEVVSFHDTAYDGLFQAQYGWGMIRVAEKDYDTARAIIKEWRQAAPAELPWQGIADSQEENEK